MRNRKLAQSDRAVKVLPLEDSYMLSPRLPPLIRERAIRSETPSRDSGGAAYSLLVTRVGTDLTSDFGGLRLDGFVEKSRESSFSSHCPSNR